MVTCTFEDGGTGKLRHVVTHAVVIKDNKILLEKRAAWLTNPGKLSLPGGYLNLNETAEEGVIRELKEETGYEGKIIKLLSLITNPNRKGEDRQNVAITYLVEPGEQTSQPDNESTEVKWFDLDNLPPEEDFAFDHFEIIQTTIEDIK
jgi:8-oxo-dGTP diphosphatase